MKQTAISVLIAGATATLAFDAFGQGFSPLFGYAKLAPVGLANASIQSIFGSAPSGAAYLLHLLTGVVFYTLGYLMIARPIQKAVMPNLHWSVTAAAYGVVLWVFALYIMAHLVAGMKPFLGFTGITWVALWGHILFAVVAAWVLEARGAAFAWHSKAEPLPA